MGGSPFYLTSCKGKKVCCRFHPVQCLFRQKEVSPIEFEEAYCEVSQGAQASPHDPFRYRHQTSTCYHCLSVAQPPEAMP